jgi:serine/threonine protein kinase
MNALVSVINDYNLDLLKRMLIVNPKERIRLVEIMEHDWIRKDVELSKELKKVEEVFMSTKKPCLNFDTKIINKVDGKSYQCLD